MSKTIQDRDTVTMED